MKYGNLIHNGLSRGEDNRVVNLGDAFEIIAIDEIYERMGISREQIVEIDMYELDKYNGEPVILPINFMLATQSMGANILKMSQNIIPIFLGVTFGQTRFTKEQLGLLKNSEPIGCRDERTKNILLSGGVKAYLGGCIVSTITRKSKKRKRKVAFIDVPLKVHKYIPEEIRRDGLIMHHEFVVSYEEIRKDNSLKNRARQRIDFYAENIRMIVTSRFHAAVIGLALGIPVILVAENNFYKFSWLSKLLPFYNSADAASIDWNPKAVNIDDIKGNMIEIAISRIKNANALYNLSTVLDNSLSNESRCDDNALLYYSGAIDYIKFNWKKDDEIQYSFWGINENTTHINDFIKQNYPKAKLTKIYDGLRTVIFEGMQSETPTKESMEKESFLFVTSNTAARVAEELLREIHKKNYYLCHLEFIRE